MPQSPSRPDLIAVSREVSDGNTVILIGLKNAPEGGVDYSALGFGAKSEDLKNFAPKYMATFGADGFQAAYSFELGEDGKGLPKELLDAQKIRKQMLLGNKDTLTLQALTKVLTYPGVSVFSKFYGVFGLNKGERRRVEEGMQLLDIVQTKMASNDDVRTGLRQPPGDYPGLDPALDQDRLTQINVALTARFNPKGLISLAARAKDRPDLAEQLRVQTRSDSVRRLNLFTETANRNHLKVIRASDRFAILLLDCQNIPKDEHYDGKRLNLRGTPARIAERTGVAAACADGKRWAPLAMYGLEREKAAIEVIDFNDPTRLRDKKLLEDSRLFAQSVLQATLPQASLGVTVADLIFTDERKRAGSTIFIDARPTSAELEIEGATGKLEPDMAGVILDPIKRDLDLINGISPNERDFLKQGLDSTDADTRKVAVNRSLELIAYHQSGSRFFSGGDRQRQHELSNQVKSAEALASGIKDRDALERIDGKIAKHAERSAENAAKQKRKDEENAAKQAAKPAEPAPIPRYDCDPSQKSQVVFMIDGLRPDRLKRAAEKGLIPNIEANVLSHSVQFRSYATTSISSAAWAAMMSGEREDRTGVIGASSSSRDPSDPDESWLDPRRDYKYYYVGAKPEGNRIFQAIKENGGDIIPTGVERERVYQSFFPAHDGRDLPILGFAKLGKEAGLGLAYGSLNPPELLDAAAAEQARMSIEKDPCRYLSVRVYMPGMDDDSHRNPYALASEGHNSFRVLDKAIGRVIEAAKKDPVLKNATYFFVSDHGLAGGIEYADTDGSLKTGVTKPILISNTSFNPVRFYTGDYPGASQDYGETVCADMWPDEPSGGVLSLPFRTVYRPYTFRSRGKNPGKKGEDTQKGCTINVESYGNDRGDILIDTARGDPTVRATYQELSASRTPTGRVVNRIDDVLSYTLLNTTVDGNAEAKSLMEERTGRHPVKFLAMGFQGQKARDTADALGGDAPRAAGPSQWDPTLVLSLGKDGKKKAGLILGKIVQDGTIRYRYLVLKNFNQLPDGAVSGTVSRSPMDDPFELEGSDGMNLDPLRWMSEREAVAASESSPYPTGIVSAAIIFNRTGSAHNKKYLSRIPDYVLYANQFFDFNTYEGQIADHGGPTKVESATTLIVSNPNCDGNIQASGLPVLSRQLHDTMEELLTGKPGGSHNESLAKEIRDACSRSQAAAAAKAERKPGGGKPVPRKGKVKTK